MGAKPSRAAPIDPYSYDKQLPSGEDEIAMTFKKIDADGDHGLTADEWVEGLAKAGIKVDPNQAKVTFERADKDHDGKISQVLRHILARFLLRFFESVRPWLK